MNESQSDFKRLLYITVLIMIFVSICCVISSIFDYSVNRKNSFMTQDTESQIIFVTEPFEEDCLTPTPFDEI